MLAQLTLGTVLMLCSILMAGLTFILLDEALDRIDGWLRKPPHWPKLMFLLCAASLTILLQVTVSVWLWALTMRFMGLFESLELSVYFALTCFTTLGFGDVLLPEGWRLLGGLAATNGLLNIGFTTAVMVETMRFVRKIQVEEKRSKVPL